MRILGVDPGSVITGYGILDHTRGDLTLVAQGTVRCAKSGALPERLLSIWTELNSLIVQYAPHVLAVESPFVGKNAKSLIQLAHARGVVLLAARNAGLDVIEYTPSAIKSAVVGYGGAEKEQVAKMVGVLIPETRKVKVAIDASDALAVAICHAHSARLGTLAARAT